MDRPHSTHLFKRQTSSFLPSSSSTSVVTGAFALLLNDGTATGSMHTVSCIGIGRKNSLFFWGGKEICSILKAKQLFQNIIVLWLVIRCAAGIHSFLFRALQVFVVFAATDYHSYPS